MDPLLLSKLLSMSSSPLSRALPYITAYFPSSLSSFSTLSAYYSQASPFVSTLLPSDYGVGFITKFASNVTPFLSDAGSHLYNFIGTITTFFGGPGVVLAIIGATSITTTAIYFFWPDENGFTNWDRRDELTWEDYSKLALYVLAANVATLSCGVLAIHSYGLLMAYLEPADEPVVEEPKKGVPDLAVTENTEEDKKKIDNKETNKTEIDKLNEETAKINKETAEINKETAETEKEKTQSQEQQLSLGSVIQTATSIVALGKTLGLTVPIIGGLTVTASVVGAGVAYRKEIADKAGEAVEAVSNSIYGSFEERLDIGVEILKELDKNTNIKEGAMQRMIDRIPIAFNLEKPDPEAIKKHYKNKSSDTIKSLLEEHKNKDVEFLLKEYEGKSVDPIELLLLEITVRLTINFQKHKPDEPLPKEFNPLQAYKDMIYPTSMVESAIESAMESVENAVDAVISIPENIMNSTVKIIGAAAEEVRRNQESMRIANGMREGTIPISVNIKTGIGVNIYGQELKPKKQKPHVSIHYSDEAKHDLLEEQLSALKQDNNMRTLLIE